MNNLLGAIITGILVVTPIQTNMVGKQQYTNNTSLEQILDYKKTGKLRKRQILITAFKSDYQKNFSEKVAQYMHDNYGYDILLLDSEFPVKEYARVNRYSRGKKIIVSLGMSKFSDGDTSDVHFPYIATNKVIVNNFPKEPLYIYRQIDSTMSINERKMMPVEEYYYMHQNLQESESRFSDEINPGKGACNYFVWKNIEENHKNLPNSARRYFLHVPNKEPDPAYYARFERILRSFQE
jgi:hypothetical protein